MMEKWTVILKTPVGLHFEVVEADTAEKTDDGKSLEFFNMDAFADTLETIVKWTNHPPQGHKNR